MPGRVPLHCVSVKCSTERSRHWVLFRLATSVCQLRHDQMEQDCTGPHTGHRTYMLRFGGAEGN